MCETSSVFYLTLHTHFFNYSNFLLITTFTVQTQPVFAITYTKYFNIGNTNGIFLKKYRLHFVESHEQPPRIHSSGPRVTCKEFPIPQPFLVIAEVNLHLQTSSINFPFFWRQPQKMRIISSRWGFRIEPSLSLSLQGQGRGRWMHSWNERDRSLCIHGRIRRWCG